MTLRYGTRHLLRGVLGECLAPGDAKQCIEEAKKTLLFLTDLLEANT